MIVVNLSENSLMSLLKYRSITKFSQGFVFELRFKLQFLNYPFLKQGLVFIIMDLFVSIKLKLGIFSSHIVFNDLNARMMSVLIRNFGKILTKIRSFLASVSSDIITADF